MFSGVNFIEENAVVDAKRLSDGDYIGLRFSDDTGSSEIILDENLARQLGARLNEAIFWKR